MGLSVGGKSPLPPQPSLLDDLLDATVGRLSDLSDSIFERLQDALAAAWRRRNKIGETDA